MGFSIFIGFISATWISLIFSWFFFKQLGLASTLMTIIVLLIAAVFLWFKAREENKSQEVGFKIGRKKEIN